jgi:hypothetical protein
VKAAEEYPRASRAQHALVEDDDETEVVCWSGNGMVKAMEGNRKVIEGYI